MKKIGKVHGLFTLTIARIHIKAALQRYNALSGPARGANQNVAGSEIFQDLLFLWHRLKVPAGNVVKLLLLLAYAPIPSFPRKGGR